MYWCDARTDKIERINLETGENREVVLANNNMDMFSVSVFESYIYWSDRSDAASPDNVCFKVSFAIPCVILFFFVFNQDPR